MFSSLLIAYPHCNGQSFSIGTFTRKLTIMDEETIQTLYGVRGIQPKMKAQKYENEGFRRPDWGQIIVDCMKFCLQTKYEQCEDFRTTLHMTNGLIIVEDETSRKTKK